LKLRWLALLICVCAFGASAAEGALEPVCDTDLIPLKRTEPQFPRAALVNGVSGWVQMEGVVGPDGSVIEVHVVESDSSKLFDVAAMSAVKRWKFEPCMVGGVPVARKFAQRIYFNLEDLPEILRANLVTGRRDEVGRLVIDLAALCPERYAHADDQLNRALSAALLRRRGENPPPTKPLPKDDFDAEKVLESYANCLFSSWEQVRDPVAIRTAVRYARLPTVASPAVRAGLCGLSPSGSGAWPECAPVPKTLAAGSQDPAQARRFWLFSRLNEGYATLIELEVTRRNIGGDMDIAVDVALKASQAAIAREDRQAGFDLLNAALAKATVPADRALLELALGRAHFRKGRTVDAIAPLQSVATSPQAPWDVQQSARYLLVVVAIEVGDGTLFDQTLTSLHAALGVDDELKY
jgi:TonB family protein